MSLALTTSVNVNAVLQTNQTPPAPISGEVLAVKYRATAASGAPVNPWTAAGNTPATDANGNAMLNVPGLNVGSQYDFEVDFAGDAAKGYNASSGQALAQAITVGTTVTVTVKSA